MLEIKLKPLRRRTCCCQATALGALSALASHCLQEGLARPQPHSLPPSLPAQVSDERKLYNCAGSRRLLPKRVWIPPVEEGGTKSSPQVHSVSTPPLDHCQTLGKAKTRTQVTWMLPSLSLPPVAQCTQGRSQAKSPCF